MAGPVATGAAVSPDAVEIARRPLAARGRTKTGKRGRGEETWRAGGGGGEWVSERLGAVDGSVAAALLRLLRRRQLVERI